jgi:hypothetical protein
MGAEPMRIMSRQEDFALLYDTIGGTLGRSEMDMVLAFLLAGLVAAGELVARYKDNPDAALYSPPAWLYMFLNGMIAVAAYYCLEHYAPDLLTVTTCIDEDAATACPPVNVPRVAAAAFGSLAIMRTAFARVLVGGQEIGLGPSAFIEIFQRAADRGVDRRRGAGRLSELPKELTGLPMAIAGNTLVPLCIELMQNLTADEEKNIADRIQLIVGKLQMPEQIRPLMVALVLQEFVGRVVLEAALKKITVDYADIIKESVNSRAEMAARAAPGLFTE